MSVVKKEFLFVLIIITFSVINTEKKEARIKLKGKNEWEIVYNNFTDEDIYVAQAFYTDSLNETGWDKLSISTNSMFNDELQAEAAGRLEGELTQDRIYNHFLNLKDEYNISENISDFFQKQESFVFESIEKEGKKDPMLYNAYLIKIQYNAIMEQYNSVANVSEQLTKDDFHLMNYVAELIDLSQKFKVEKYGKTDYSKMSNKEFMEDFFRRTHCSALIKIKNDLSDIYFGHNTWNSYYSAIRIFKEYNFNYNNRWIISKNIIFSSYPATLSSLDDFYVTSHGLIVMETTNAFYNDTMYDVVVPESLFTGERVMIANRISNSSKEWADNFVKYNSGTYNNQFMALDKNKVDLVNRTIDYDAFYIVEQIPGFTKINNVTQFMKFGYWSSFNVPYDKEIFAKSEIQKVIDERPEAASSLDYDKCARTKIFRREQSSADSLEGFMKLMRFNNYTIDPYSEGDPSLTIASRADLRVNGSSCHGAYDAKIGALSEFANNGTIKVHIISGPTWNDEEGIKPFNWTEAPEGCNNHSHELLPEVMQFDWTEYNNDFDF